MKWCKEMPRKQEKNIKICPSCGTIVEKPEKTWHLTSPLPDAQGRITITIMASFTCPNCGAKWKGVLSKIKVGGQEVEIEGGAKTSKLADEKKTERPGEIIELNIDDIMNE